MGSRKKLTLAVVVAAAVSYATVEAAKPPQQEPAARSASNSAASAHATAEVVKVDKLASAVTVRDAKGEQTRIMVPPEVANLDSIRTGARLDIRYAPARAEALAKPAASAAVEESVVVPEAAVEPSSRTRYVVGRVESVDLPRRELKVKGPDDETITLRVPPGTAGFEASKPGDAVAVRFTEAVALVVTPKGG